MKQCWCGYSCIQWRIFCCWRSLQSNERIVPLLWDNPQKPIWVNLDFWLKSTLTRGDRLGLEEGKWFSVRHCSQFCHFGAWSTLLPAPITACFCPPPRPFKPLSTCLPVLAGLHGSAGMHEAASVSPPGCLQGFLPAQLCTLPVQS